MSGLGVYLPLESPVHRLPAEVKLAALTVAAVLGVLVGDWWQALALVAGTLLLYVVARIPGRVALAQVRPVLWMVAAIAAFQAVVAGWERAVVVSGSLLGLVLLASLLSLTTRTTDLVRVVERGVRPLRRVGVDPERVALMVALATRSVAVVVGIAQEVRQAQLARGAGWSPMALAVPLVVRSIRHADQMADALVARGIDD